MNPHFSNSPSASPSLMKVQMSLNLSPRREPSWLVKTVASFEDRATQMDVNDLLLVCFLLIITFFAAALLVMAIRNPIAAPYDSIIVSRAPLPFDSWYYWFGEFVCRYFPLEAKGGCARSPSCENRLLPREPLVWTTAVCLPRP